MHGHCATIKSSPHSAGTFFEPAIQVSAKLIMWLRKESLCVSTKPCIYLGLIPRAKMAITKHGWASSRTCKGLVKLLVPSVWPWSMCIRHSVSRLSQHIPGLIHHELIRHVVEEVWNLVRIFSERIWQLDPKRITLLIQQLAPMTSLHHLQSFYWCRLSSRPIKHLAVPNLSFPRVIDLKLQRIEVSCLKHEFFQPIQQDI